MAPSTGQQLRPGPVDAQRSTGRTEADAQMGRTEANFHRLVYYQAAVLWSLGAGERAVSVLGDLVTDAVRRHATHRGP